MSEPKDKAKNDPNEEPSSELRPEDLEGVSGGVSTPGTGAVQSPDDVKVRIR